MTGTKRDFPGYLPGRIGIGAYKALPPPADLFPLHYLPLRYAGGIVDTDLFSRYTSAKRASVGTPVALGQLRKKILRGCSAQG